MLNHVMSIGPIHIKFNLILKIGPLDLDLGSSGKLLELMPSMFFTKHRFLAERNLNFRWGRLDRANSISGRSDFVTARVEKGMLTVHLNLLVPLVKCPTKSPSFVYFETKIFKWR